MFLTETEEHNFEQRCAIKFCVKLVETSIETFNKLKQAYGGACFVKITSVQVV